MIDILNLVRGAVSNADLIPVLTHFHIRGGRIQGYNGRMVIDAPIPELDGVDATVPADRFLKAVDACAGSPKIALVEGKLRISRKGFRATLALLPGEDFPAAQPTPGKQLKCPGILGTIKVVLPFVGEDASRAWVCSILFKDGRAWATTNTTIAWVATTLDKGLDLAVPGFLAEELMRIGKPPEYLTSDAGSVTFYYADGSWLRGSTYSEQWPDMAKFREQIDAVQPAPLPADLALHIDQLAPFVKDVRFPVLLMEGSGLRTEEGDHSAEVDGLDLPTARYDLRVLKLVVSNATHAQFASGPGVFRNTVTGLAGLFTSLRA